METYDKLHKIPVVKVKITGPKGVYFGDFILDTGATTTLVRKGILEELGYDDAIKNSKVIGSVRTGSGSEPTIYIEIDCIEAIAQTKYKFIVGTNHKITDTQRDGFLGVNFLKDFTLVIDFPNRILDLQ
jgi:predicted aspartyl protease